MPRCSSKIFVPKKIKITPPITCALSFKARPKNFPTWTPKKEIPKVVSPISRTTREIFIFKKAKETPTAKASIDVAIAKINKFFMSSLSSSIGQVFSLASLIIFSPINPSRTKAIQWSIAWSLSAKIEPKKYPIRGINPWKTPKKRAITKDFS